MLVVLAAGVVQPLAARVHLPLATRIHRATPPLACAPAEGAAAARIRAYFAAWNELSLIHISEPTRPY